MATKYDPDRIYRFALAVAGPTAKPAEDGQQLPGPVLANQFRRFHLPRSPILLQLIEAAVNLSRSKAWLRRRSMRASGRSSTSSPVTDRTSPVAQHPFHRRDRRFRTVLSRCCQRALRPHAPSRSGLRRAAPASSARTGKLHRCNLDRAAPARAGWPPIGQDRPGRKAGIGLQLTQSVLMRR